MAFCGADRLWRLLVSVVCAQAGRAAGESLAIAEKSGEQISADVMGKKTAIYRKAQDSRREGSCDIGPALA